VRNEKITDVTEKRAASLYKAEEEAGVEPAIFLPTTKLDGRIFAVKFD
jgi:hypothetical protein